MSGCHLVKLLRSPCGQRWQQIVGVSPPVKDQRPSTRARGPATAPEWARRARREGRRGDGTLSSSALRQVRRRSSEDQVARGSFSCRAPRHSFRVGPRPLVQVRRGRSPRRAEGPSEVGRAVRVRRTLRGAQLRAIRERHHHPRARLSAIWCVEKSAADKRI